MFVTSIQMNEPVVCSFMFYILFVSGFKLHNVLILHHIKVPSILWFSSVSVSESNRKKVWLHTYAYSPSLYNYVIVLVISVSTINYTANRGQWAMMCKIISGHGLVVVLNADCPRLLCMHPELLIGTMTPARRCLDASLLMRTKTAWLSITVVAVFIAIPANIIVMTLQLLHFCVCRYGFWAIWSI